MELGGASAGLPPSTGAPAGVSAPPVAAAGTMFLPSLPASAAPTANVLPAFRVGSSNLVVSAGATGGNGKSPPPPDAQPALIWVLDANNAIVVTPGVTKHDFSGWDVDLRAQVAGGTVSSYSWDVSNAPDVTATGGKTTYNLTFTWATFNQGSNGPHTDTIVLTTVDPIHGTQTQTLTFSVIGQDSPAWVAVTSRPTKANLLLPSIPVITYVRRQRA